MIIVCAPRFKLLLRVSNREEQVDVQALITHATVEAFDVAVLGR
ncbi:MAG: hypothetical protein RLZZ129_1058, partial [Verrucomicrobiota bacterium]